MALKLSLQHSLFYFDNIGCYFASIRGTVVKIRAKTFIRMLYNWVYCISHSIFRTLEVILHRLEIRLPRYKWKLLFANFKIIYGFLRFIFTTLVFILRQLEVLLPKYGKKCSFAGFEIGFLAFAVLFLEHWMLYGVYWRYICQDMGDKVNLSALQLGYDISSSIFRTLEFILCRLEVRLPRYKRKHLFSGFEI